MDPTRQIRLLVAPFFFFASLVLAYLTAGKEVPLQNNILALIGVITLSTLPVGFLISSLAFILLRVLFRAFGSNFETHLSEEDIDRIWPKLNTSIGRHACSKASKSGAMRTPKDIELYVAATFDHGILYEKSRGVHEWIMRVFTAFMTSVNSLVAILISYAAVAILCLSPSWQWWLCTGVIVIVLFIGAWRAQRTMLKMFEFQTHRMFEGYPNR